jgi:tRNA A-37 threonylcarbamoyl transferase component Bud32
MYRKEFTKTPKKDLVREVKLMRKSAELGLSPNVLKTDQTTFIEMEHSGPTISEAFGEHIDDLPNDIRQSIYSILQTLWQHGIQYRDVTPYNFTFKDGRVWIIDFGHANEYKRLDKYLRHIFNEGWLVNWNPDFISLSALE